MNTLHVMAAVYHLAILFRWSQRCGHHLPPISQSVFTQTPPAPTSVSSLGCIQL